MSPYGMLMGGFHLHVLYQSFNVKPSNVKKKKEKVTPENKKDGIISYAEGVFFQVVFSS